MLPYKALRQQRPRSSGLQQSLPSTLAATQQRGGSSAQRCSYWRTASHATGTGSIRTFQTTAATHALSSRLRSFNAFQSSGATKAPVVRRNGKVPLSPRVQLSKREPTANPAAQSPSRGKYAFKLALRTGSSKGASAAAATIQEDLSILRRLEELEEHLDQLQSQSFNISQRLQHLLPQLIAREAQSGWGSDRLAVPTPASESAPAPSSSNQWNASASTPSPSPQHSGHSNASSASTSRGPAERAAYRASSRPPSGLLQGEDAHDASLLKLRDSYGRLDASVSYTGPIADEKKKWSETVSGSITGHDVLIEKVEPLRKMEVPALAHGLDRVLFNPSIYWMRDPRSGIYNFDPRIRDVLDVDLFDYEALTPYITSSKDPELAKLTKRHGSKFCGSTSSMTGLLSQCYFHISGWRDPDTSGFSAPFKHMPGGFSFGAKLPASIVLNWQPDADGSGGGHYAIDADKESAGEAANNNYVLTSLGKSMEKMLTSTPEEYARYMRINSADLSTEDRNRPESYHYAQAGKLMMRSQLDCSDDRLPRRTFDLKTRASVGIRNDRANYVEGSGYQIRRATGLVESFEREYYDMIRAAFLKYNFQARIGHMDGIFVAYHTTSTIYGFQYISVEEMNERLFGSEEMADQSFRLSLGMLENVLEAATNLFPRQTLKLTVETKDKANLPMSVFVEATETPAASSSTPSDSDDPSASPPARSIAQLDIAIDRYLDHSLVSGPVDFSLLPGRNIDPMTEDEIVRRMRLSLPSSRFDIDFKIDPRGDLSEKAVREGLDAIRERQRSLSSLIIPNLEVVRERDLYREEMLKENPEALRRFREEKRKGEIGMPVAPGQDKVNNVGGSSKATKTTSESVEKDNSTTTTQEEDAATARQRMKKEAIEARWMKLRNAKALRLRELARLGAKDSKEEGTREMFRSRS